MDTVLLRKKTCRICGGTDLEKILDLGEMPPANSFLKKENLSAPEQKFPLTIYYCENCKLVQLLDVVNPNILFRSYNYLTSASKPLIEHFRKMGDDIVSRFIQDPREIVVEIGGNDAVLLEGIQDRCHVINVEPAINIAEIAAKKGINTINKFFNKEVAEEILQQYGPAKIVVGNNVMAHIDDIQSVWHGIKTLIG